MLSGRLLVHGDGEPAEAVPGSLFVAPRGHRHGFSNPLAEGALVLGIWAPPEPALAFMREIGAALSPDGARVERVDGSEGGDAEGELAYGG